MNSFPASTSFDNSVRQKEETMPVVIVEMWEGRTIEQKKQLVEGITSVMVNMGVPAEVVHIIIKDNPKHNWASGGKLASE
ncbi:2-hydroxymuconate tautomerase [Chloroflexota bacterium]